MRLVLPLRRPVRPGSVPRLAERARLSPSKSRIRTGRAGPVIPAPFSPAPAEQPAGPRADQTPSTQTGPPTDRQANSPTPLTTELPHSPEPPTIITAGRPRGLPFDPNLGPSLAGRR